MSLKIGSLEIKYPIIQGGMAIKASMARLASAVAREGGIGLIAGTGLTPTELKDEIKKARELAKGVIGVNIMVAAANFLDLVKASIDAGIDLVVFGAGFSRDVFQMGKESNTPIVPIVSSLKLAKVSEKLGASAIIVEGGNAGGHLGTDKASWDIVAEIKKSVKIPVIGAGGVVTPEDATRMFALGVDGVQMGTRFIASDESDVSDVFKQLYVKAKKGDVVEMMSSVGLPANAIRTAYVEKILKGETEPPSVCIKCLKKCTCRFCVKDRLIKGHDGDLEEGLFFAGRDVWKIDSILPVKEIFDLFKPVLPQK